jgi:hypothetical protein
MNLTTHIPSDTRSGAASRAGRNAKVSCAGRNAKAFRSETALSHVAVLMPPSRRDAARRGATLLVTLGILTVLSVMIVGFLVAARLQRQTAASDQNRLAARNYMDAGLHLAMRQVEDALTYPNYTEQTVGEGEFLTHQRLAPVGQWFSADYDKTNELSDDVSYQAPDVLASPTVEGSPHVNLLTPQVLRLIPSALTNGLPLSAHQTPSFRSGWIPLDLLPTNAPLSMRLRSKPARIAYAVFNCSGFIDANTFSTGPTAQKLPRTCFSQADVTNWVAEARQNSMFNDLEDLWDDHTLPFFHLSYDPDPNIYPLHYDCFETTPTLGTYAFGSGPVIDLNTPLSNLMLGAMKNAPDVVRSRACFWKFNLNSITNHFERGTESTDESAPWFNDMNFRAEWLDPVSFLLEMMGHEEPAATRHRLPGGNALPWTIANFMDADRIPQVSTFAADEDGNQELATRVNYAVEDVPLINKVSVFSIFDPDHPGSKNPDTPHMLDPDYYFDGADTSMLSNHYAVAVELWYPFAPNPPPPDTACYVGIYTNAADVVTTTNKPWSQDLMRDWLRWNFSQTSNTVMQTLFYAWGARYRAAVGPSIWAHPLWLTVNQDSDLWFSSSMTNHMFWPEAGTNDTYDITANPIWQAFYPETYDEVETNVIETVTLIGGTPVTNQVEVVTTNVYTTIVSTNTVLDWVIPPATTNRMLVAFHGETPADYPWVVWSNPSDGTFSTNRMTGFDLFDGTEARLSESNQLTYFFADGDDLWVVVTNTVDGSEAFDAVKELYLLDGSTNTLTVSSDDFVIYEEIERVKPLPMPGNLGTILDGLIGMLPTNSVSHLYDFLMATPEDLDLDDWNKLFVRLTQIPGIFDKLFPSNSEPSLGNMTEADRHILWPEGEKDDAVVLDDLKNDKIQANQFQGYFWTVYPKQTISFMEVTREIADKDGVVTQPASTNYYALGDNIPGHDGRNTIWIRPVTTVWPTDEATEAEEELIGDKIVDEALLTHDNDNAVPVWGWTSVTNLCIPDPRNNAFARNWRAFPKTARWKAGDAFDDVLNTTNLNTGVHELPFIHFNGPFSTIGDIGHVYASYSDRQTSEDADDEAEFLQRLKYDTVTFSTRSGAALLDIFTLSPTNRSTRGLVQANTQHASVIKTLLADVTVGWTNIVDGTVDELGLKQLPLTKTGSNEKDWSDVYADALTNAPYSMGWRSFADMLPSLSTNQVFAHENVWGGSADLHPMHDYTEDVLRGLVDKVSFRQNIFVVVVAAQALSPASTAARPVVLSDQRAAVTVIRDAYTGRWVIHSWVWLTE